MEPEAAEPAPSSSIEDVNKQIDDVKKQMCKNVEAILIREEKAGALWEKAEEMSGAAECFKKTGKKVEHSYKAKNIKLFVLIGVIVLIVILIIILLATGVIPVSGSVSVEPPTTSKP